MFHDGQLSNQRRWIVALILLLAEREERSVGSRAPQAIVILEQIRNCILSSLNVPQVSSLLEPSPKCFDSRLNQFHHDVEASAAETWVGVERPFGI